MAEKVNRRGRNYTSGSAIDKALRQMIVEEIIKQGGDARSRSFPGTYIGVAELYRVSTQTVKNIWERYCDSGSCSPKPHAGGRQKKLTAGDLSYIKELKYSVPNITYSQIQKCLMYRNRKPKLCYQPDQNLVKDPISTKSPNTERRAWCGIRNFEDIKDPKPPVQVLKRPKLSPDNISAMAEAQDLPLNLSNPAKFGGKTMTTASDNVTLSSPDEDGEVESGIGSSSFKKSGSTCKYSNSSPDGVSPALGLSPEMALSLNAKNFDDDELSGCEFYAPGEKISTSTICRAVKGLLLPQSKKITSSTKLHISPRPSSEEKIFPEHNINNSRVDGILNLSKTIEQKTDKGDTFEASKDRQGLSDKVKKKSLKSKNRPKTQTIIYVPEGHNSAGSNEHSTDDYDGSNNKDKRIKTEIMEGKEKTDFIINNRNPFTDIPPWYYYYKQGLNIDEYGHLIAEPNVPNLNKKQVHSISELLKGSSTKYSSLDDRHVDSTTDPHSPHLMKLLNKKTSDELNAIKDPYNWINFPYWYSQYMYSIMNPYGNPPSYPQHYSNPHYWNPELLANPAFMGFQRPDLGSSLRPYSPVLQCKETEVYPTIGTESTLNDGFSDLNDIRNLNPNVPSNYHLSRLLANDPSRVCCEIESTENPAPKSPLLDEIDLKRMRFKLKRTRSTANRFNSGEGCLSRDNHQTDEIGGTNMSSTLPSSPKSLAGRRSSVVLSTDLPGDKPEILAEVEDPYLLLNLYHTALMTRNMAQAHAQCDAQLHIDKHDRFEKSIGTIVAKTAVSLTRHSPRFSEKSEPVYEESLGSQESLEEVQPLDFSCKSRRAILT